MSDPSTISKSDPRSSESLKWIATLHQVSSPFPDRAITILTTYTMLHNERHHGENYAFRRRLMKSPVSVDDEDREIWMYPKGWRINHMDPPSGNPNLRLRSDMEFVTIPPVGQGEARIERGFSPETLFACYKHPASLEEKLADFKSGERFAIKVEYRYMGWWTWGSLDTDLKSKKFARWSFPEELPLNRAPEDDETEEMSHRLEDPVDGHDVNHLSSASAVENEDVPNIRQMRREGWIFGEPTDGIEVVAKDKAIFEFVD